MQDWSALEVGIWVVGGLLTVIGALMAVIWAQLNAGIRTRWKMLEKKLDENMTLHTMYIEEVADTKKNTEKALGWLKSHERRIQMIEDSKK